MGSVNLYTKPVKENKNRKGKSLISSLLLAGMFISAPFVSKAIPTFVKSDTVLTVCENSTNNDITSLLAINDPSTSAVETWFIESSPVNGTPANGSLSGFNAVGLANGGTLLPVGLTYTPNAGFSGTDQFSIGIADDIGDTSYVTIIVGVSALPSVTWGSMPVVCQGATSANLTFSAVTNLGPTTQTFAPVAFGQSWSVPPGVTNIAFDVEGATGGLDNYSGTIGGTPVAGNGARVTGTLNVTPSQQLYVYVGGSGNAGSVGGAAGGFNGGGNAINYSFGCGGSGGGASDVRLSGTGLANRIVVAGGGAGSGWDTPGPSDGGNGGAPTGGVSGNNVSGSHAGGGTVAAGGSGATYPPTWTAGGNGSLGQGGSGSPDGVSGGGGGGYYGGGGGVWTGGGGGSSYANSTYASGVTMTSGYNALGNGSVTFNYTVPATYNITWGPSAAGAGFTDVHGASFPSSSPVSVAVPPAAAPGYYTGQLSVSNPTCTSVTYTISITIDSVPQMDTVDFGPLSTSICNGTVPTTPVVSFYSTMPLSTTFSWSNNNTTIGLGMNGTGDSLFFSPTDTSTAVAAVAVVTVTPTANGCSGTPIPFSITVMPSPQLTSASTISPLCDSAVLSYNPTNSVGGATTMDWFASFPAGAVTTPTFGTDSTATGSGNPNINIVNNTNSDQNFTLQYHLDASGCITYSTPINITVHPKPALAASTAPLYICNNTVYVATNTSAVTNPISVAWSRSATAGLSDAASSGTGMVVTETLHDTTSAPVNATYTYTTYITADSACWNSQTVTVTVEPTPMLTSGLSDGSACSDQYIMGYYASSASDPSITYTWYRGDVSGISPATSTDTGNYISDSLHSTLTLPQVVYYGVTMNINGTTCSNTQNVAVTVNPTPVLTHAGPFAICDSTVFSFNPATLSPDSTFTWTRDTVTGISNPAMGPLPGNPNETLVNTTYGQVTVAYVYSIMANSCMNTQTVNVVVAPKLQISTPLTGNYICNGDTVKYSANSYTTGTVFTWYRAYVPGIYALQDSGVGQEPGETLLDTTNFVVPVTYLYTMSNFGCMDTESVVINVNPTPRLSSDLSASVCSGYPFSYRPFSYTPGAQFEWDRPTVTGINPANNYSSLGAGLINETLTNSTFAPLVTQYEYNLSINGCINPHSDVQVVNVTVNPTPPPPTISTTSASTLCSGTQFQNFAISNTLSNVVYYWSASNATVEQQNGNGHSSLITFGTAGNAVVMVNSYVDGYPTCVSSSSYDVTVSGSSMGAAPTIIYTGNQFICLDNTVSSYQWGYDDMSTLSSVSLSGQTQQDYINSSPDFTHNAYWCVTSSGDCMQKSYYNRPTGIANVDDAVTVKVYPNPAQSNVNVEFQNVNGGNMQVDILNLLGQKIGTQTVVDNKATLNVANLPAGCYILDCFRNGSKITSARFIKN
jgi:Glycine rich protein/Secretion system C-terminal sorting domain/PKD-like domain